MYQICVQNQSKPINNIMSGFFSKMQAFGVMSHKAFKAISQFNFDHLIKHLSNHTVKPVLRGHV